MTDLSPTHLLRTALAGDADARDEAFDLFRAELRQIARWGLGVCDAPAGHSILVTELIDRAFVAAIRGRKLASQLDSRRDFVRYARRCILNEIKRRLRARDRRGEVEPIDPPARPADSDRAEVLTLVARLEDWLDATAEQAERSSNDRLAEAVTIFREVLWNGLRIELVQGAGGGDDLILRFGTEVKRKTFAEAAAGLGMCADTASNRYDLIRERMLGDPAIRRLLEDFRGANR
jgi:DNA-directed RNA polymerase specialized sigma24 family protein